MVLKTKGYEVFLPLYSKRSDWSDRVRVVNVPLFPGYLFCQMDAAARLPVLTTPGVVGILGDGSKAIAVNNDEVDTVRRIVESGLPVFPNKLETGQTVRVIRGPLTGLNGVYMGSRSNSRLIVSLALLQRAVAVEIDSTWILPGELAPSKSGLVVPQIAG